MATQASMLTNIKRYLDKIIALFAKTSGNKDQVLVYDNSDGVFSFTPELAIPIWQIATTPNEVSQAKAAIKANPVGAGTLLINVLLQTAESYSVANDTWTSHPELYPVYVKRLRTYYSPWGGRVWIVDKYGDFHRLMTTGLTLVG
ncbi:hypothetical protein MZD04_gp266 [Pseudomonas phage Psa21]|uniref:Uncharacterized protein n=1 Tax=Pseudomonas phage Psa21 TaxID=2530023 RepID=A0A481W525_9CAUD|nr:hypothetical protein MZD04_gp266 [Pseudomonas phage Psa21]QBJ02792.1 hypothetical protein PSA21_266 [Pseudomonas phage Psa21]